MNCPNCGASQPPVDGCCGYCGGVLSTTGEGQPAALVSTVSGGGGARGWTLCLLGMGVLYGLGWVFEDTRYWLDTRAVILWGGVLPLWLVLWGGLLGRRPLAGFLTGLGLALGVLLVHTLAMTLVDGHFNDDHLGISALYGGACLLGWLLGWGIRQGIRR